MYVYVNILLKPLMSLFAELKLTGVKDTQVCLCEEVVFSASSEERERSFKASKLHNFMLSVVVVFY